MVTAPDLRHGSVVLADDVFGVSLAAELQRTTHAKTVWLLSVRFSSDDPSDRARCEWLT